MSRIEELIERLCPDGVEYQELGQVCKILRGKRLTKNLLSENEKYPVYHGGLEPLGYYGQSNRVADTVMVINVGASAGTVGYSNVDFWSSDGCYCIEQPELLLSRFVYYALVCQESTLKSKVRVAGIPTLDAPVVKSIQIPVPPLEIQNEIVSILDKFTLLKAELEAELEARKTQYEHYRNALLSFEAKNVEWKTINDIAVVVTGGEAPTNSIKGLRPTEVYKYPIFGNGYEVYGYTDTYRIDKDAVTISSIGANTGTIYYRKAFFTPIIRLKVLLPKDNSIVAKFLYYYLSSIEISSKKSSVPNMNANDVKKIKVPIPLISEQEKIVSILDKFDALVNDISIGLPAEIEARRQQYEYYRNKLLTFKNVSNG